VFALAHLAGRCWRWQCTHPAGTMAFSRGARMLPVSCHSCHPQTHLFVCLLRVSAGATAVALASCIELYHCPHPVCEYKPSIGGWCVQDGRCLCCWPGGIGGLGGESVFSCTVALAPSPELNNSVSLVSWCRYLYLSVCLYQFVCPTAAAQMPRAHRIAGVRAGPRCCKCSVSWLCVWVECWAGSRPGLCRCWFAIGESVASRRCVAACVLWTCICGVWSHTPYLPDWTCAIQGCMRHTKAPSLAPVQKVKTRSRMVNGGSVESPPTSAPAQRHTLSSLKPSRASPALAVPCSKTNHHQPTDLWWTWGTCMTWPLLGVVWEAWLLQ
jgi:hypothetical protein